MRRQKPAGGFLQTVLEPREGKGRKGFLKARAVKPLDPHSLGLACVVTNRSLILHGPSDGFGKCSDGEPSVRRDNDRLGDWLVSKHPYEQPSEIVHEQELS